MVSNLQFFVVDTLPTTDSIQPFSIYIHKEPLKKTATFYKSTLDGTELVPIDGFDSIVSKLVYRGEDQPEENTEAMFWFKDNYAHVKVTEGNQTSWQRVGTAEWHYGATTPVDTLGHPGDMYLKENGDFFKREATAWVYTGVSFNTEPQGMRIINIEGIDELAEQEGTHNEFLIVKGMGQFVHEQENYDFIDGTFYLASLNGRWKLECIALDFLDTAMARCIDIVMNDEDGAELSPFYDAYRGSIQTLLGKKIVGGSFRPNYSSISTATFTVVAPGARIGAVCGVTPRHAITAYTCINSTILRDNEITVNVSHYSGSITISDDWSYFFIL